MNGGVALGLALSLASAAALSVGFVVQHGAVASLPTLTLRRPLWSLGRLFGQRRWLFGFGLGLAGWGSTWSRCRSRRLRSSRRCRRAESR